MRDLTRELGLGTCCGKCVPEAKATLAAALAQHPRSAPCAETPAYLPA